MKHLYVCTEERLLLSKQSVIPRCRHNPAVLLPCPVEEARTSIANIYSSNQGREQTLMRSYSQARVVILGITYCISPCQPTRIRSLIEYLVTISLCQEFLNIINHFVWICFRAISLHRISLMIY